MCKIGRHKWIEPKSERRGGRLFIYCARCGVGIETDLEGGMPPTPVHNDYTMEQTLMFLSKYVPEGTLLVMREKQCS
jgi:hypothetical protein